MILQPLPRLLLPEKAHIPRNPLFAASTVQVQPLPGTDYRPRNPILRVLTFAYAPDKDAQNPRMTFAGRRETMFDRAWAQRRTEASQAQPDHSLLTPLNTASPARTLALQAMGRLPTPLSSSPAGAIRPEGWIQGTGRDDSSLHPAVRLAPTCATRTCDTYSAYGLDHSVCSFIGA